MLSLLSYLYVLSPLFQFYESSRYHVDEEFAKKYEIDVPLQISFSVKHKPRAYLNAKTLRKGNHPNGLMAFQFLDSTHEEQVLELVIVNQNTNSRSTYAERMASFTAFCKSEEYKKTHTSSAVCSPTYTNRVIVAQNEFLICANRCVEEGRSYVKAVHITSDKQSQHGVTFVSYYYPPSEVKKETDVLNLGLEGGLKYILGSFELGQKSSATRRFTFEVKPNAP